MGQLAKQLAEKSTRNFVAKEAIERARRGEGPTLVECETYRFRGHSLADPDELRDPGEPLHYALFF